MSDSDRPLAWRLRSIVGEENVLVDEPMSEHTTFEVGGPADLFVTPEDIDEVREVVSAVRESGENYFLLGRGSDLLVSDAGFRGVIIALECLMGVSVEDDEMCCQAGVDLREASEMACELGLSGLEFACGIPGSVGGACYMNAGAYGACMADVLESVRVYKPARMLDDGTRGSGSIIEFDVDELNLGYRKSRIADDGFIVLSATFNLAPGNAAMIKADMDDYRQRREDKQPLDMPSAGSTFKRPEGHFAGKLITDAGLRGYQVGGAAVSKKHAGFVVNVGGATAADVHAVIEHVQAEVERQFGVRLQPEVRFLG